MRRFADGAVLGARAHRPLALGGAPRQDARARGRGDQGRPRGAQRRARQAEQGRAARRPRGDLQRVAAPLRDRACDRRAARPRERGGAAVRGDRGEHGGARAAGGRAPARAARVEGHGRPSATGVGWTRRGAGARRRDARARTSALASGALRFRYTIAILAVLMLWAGLPARAPAQSEPTLRDRIERGRERERALSGAVARLTELIARTGREIRLVQGRLDEVQ